MIENRSKANKLPAMHKRKGVLHRIVKEKIMGTTRLFFNIDNEAEYS